MLLRCRRTTTAGNALSIANLRPCPHSCCAGALLLLWIGLPDPSLSPALAQLLSYSSTEIATLPSHLRSSGLTGLNDFSLTGAAVVVRGARVLCGVCGWLHCTCRPVGMHACTQPTNVSLSCLGSCSRRRRFRRRRCRRFHPSRLRRRARPPFRSRPRPRFRAHRRTRLCHLWLRVRFTLYVRSYPQFVLKATAGACQRWQPIDTSAAWISVAAPFGNGTGGNGTGGNGSLVIIANTPPVERPPPEMPRAVRPLASHWQPLENQ